MSSSEEPHDTGSAREDGEAFGREVGAQIARDMTQARLTHAELTTIGSDGVSTILARANALAETGLDRDIVDAWADAAADAFHLQLERAAALLSAPEGSTSKH